MCVRLVVLLPSILIPLFLLAVYPSPPPLPLHPPSPLAAPSLPPEREREIFIDSLLVRVHFISVMIRWTGLAPWEFGFRFPGSLTSTFSG